MNHVQAREKALDYVVNMMDWQNSPVIGCLPDPVVPDTFLVAVEIQRTKRRTERFAIFISRGQIVDDGMLMEDFFKNGGVLDEPKKPEKRKSP